MSDIGLARDLVRGADAFVFAAGAGMGVDSGLPDFRGNEGFWRAYPPFAKLGLGFSALANPRWFAHDPHLAWGFYGHRLNLYRRTVPHDGFAVLRRWAARKPAFVFTSNVDGQFQCAGFDDEQVFECHGSIHHLQCSAECGWFADARSLELAVDALTMRALDPLPRCPTCGATARPAILMFGDGAWDDRRSSGQALRFRRFLERGAHGLVVVECGAGTAVPSVRLTSEELVRAGAQLVRINVREPEVPAGQVGLPLGAKEALQALGGGGE